MSGTYLNVWSDYLFALKKKLDNGEFTNRELVEWLDSNNPTILYSLITMIVNKGINDTAITDKLLSMSNKLDNENKVLGYYKIGHLAMSALLKLGIDSYYNTRRCILMRIKRNKYDIIVELICLIALIGTSVYLGINWNRIPEEVPMHYNVMGDINRWGQKGELLFLFFLTWIMYIGLTVIEHFPGIWNTGVTVTKENKERVYRILKSMLGTIKLLTVIIFVFLMINAIMTKELPAWFTPVSLVLVFGSIIFSVIKVVKAK